MTCRVCIMILFVAAGLLGRLPNARAAALARIVWLEPAPAHCLDPGAVERSVESRLGRSVFTTSQASVVIAARFEARANRQLVNLQISSSAGEMLGERALEAESCAQLQAALPVAIAVLLDADLEPQPQPIQEPVLARSNAPKASERSHALTLTGSSAAWLGLQPTVAWGFGLDLSVGVWGPFELAAWGDWRAPSETRSAPTLVLQALSAGASLCGMSALNRLLRAGGCAGAGALLLRAWGRDVTQPTPDQRWLAELRLTGRAELQVLGPWAGRLELGVCVPSQRPHYGFTDDQQQQQALFRPAWGWFGRVGVSVRWE